MKLGIYVQNIFKLSRTYTEKSSIIIITKKKKINGTHKKDLTTLTVPATNRL